VLTPITAEAGEWLYQRTPDSPFLDTHEHLGETMIYVAIGLVVAAGLLVFLHVRTQRDNHSAVLSAIVAVVVVLIGVAAMIQTYRVGDSGARSVWNETGTTAPAEGG
jgi:cell division protein FtsW (lipid II flippase)